MALPTSEEPRVSVVIPAHNHYGVTRRCLLALAYAPTRVPFEVIVVDDGSSDGTTEALARDVEGCRLVRHGQASFGADDYDQLSELGQRQSRRLGAYFRERGLTFEAVITGSLKRQQQTWRGIAEGLGQAELQHLVWPGLNEYDSHAVIHAIHPEPLAKPAALRIGFCFSMYPVNSTPSPLAPAFLPPAWSCIFLKST